MIPTEDQKKNVSILQSLVAPFPILAASVCVASDFFFLASVEQLSDTESLYTIFKKRSDTGYIHFPSNFLLALNLTTFKIKRKAMIRNRYNYLIPSFQDTNGEGRRRT